MNWVAMAGREVESGNGRIDHLASGLRADLPDGGNRSGSGRICRSACPVGDLGYCKTAGRPIRPSAAARKEAP